jgi:hypothetical protein
MDGEAEGEGFDLRRGLSLAAVAVASAVLTATLVIGVGSSLMHAPDRAPPGAQAPLIMAGNGG